MAIPWKAFSLLAWYQFQKEVITIPAKGKYIDMTGQRFGRLVCEHYVGADKQRASMWECTCDCGKTTIVRAADLKRKKGGVQSCGCLQREALEENRPKDYHAINVKHGMSCSRLYHIYNNMKQRCYNPNNPNYQWYGGKGVKLCDTWAASFESFAAWALKNGYEETLTIDRIDPNGHYCPENCRWITHSENTRRAALSKNIKRENL